MDHNLTKPDNAMIRMEYHQVEEVDRIFHRKGDNDKNLPILFDDGLKNCPKY
jgi:hypothetical protein